MPALLNANIFNGELKISNPHMSKVSRLPASSLFSSHSTPKQLAQLAPNQAPTKLEKGSITSPRHIPAPLLQGSVYISFCVYPFTRPSGDQSPIRDPRRDTAAPRLCWTETVPGRASPRETRIRRRNLGRWFEQSMSNKCKRGSFTTA